MRRSQTKPDRLDLFGPTGRTCPWQAPQWQNLPQPARRKITGLMARLLMECDTSQGSGPEEETRTPHQSGESDDV